MEFYSFSLLRYSSEYQALAIDSYHRHREGMPAAEAG